MFYVIFSEHALLISFSLSCVLHHFRRACSANFFLTLSLSFARALSLSLSLPFFLSLFLFLSLSFSLCLSILFPIVAITDVKGGLLCHHPRRDEESNINFVLTHLPHLQRTSCSACKVYTLTSHKWTEL